MSIMQNPNLWQTGEEKIRWAAAHMPVLQRIGERLADEQPLRGLNMTISIHLEAKTAFFARTLERAGATVYATGCNPLSTQDDVCAALARGGMEVFARHGCDAAEYEAHLLEALSCKPHLIVDDGGDLVHLLHNGHEHLAERLIGGCEETTTGILRLKSRAKAGALRFPMIDINDADSKHLFDNRYGTGQSVWDGILRTTNLTVAGSTVVVAGYGWCGKGVAMRAKGLGAQVCVTEVNPIRAVEARMDGFEVLPMEEAARRGDFFITVTGCNDVIGVRHFDLLKEGAVLANAGHFDVEVDVAALRRVAKSSFRARENIEGFVLPNGRTVYLLAEGRLVNLAAGNGHPAEIMDMSFSLQALCAEYLAKHGAALAIGNVYPVPRAIDESVAQLKLSAMGSKLDVWTEEQARYVAGWEC
ncbi:MAG TPA: adenosylhomocysteinase [Clostridia bacterium]|nr:adenosylhomocysteinase [Clostridia bacterium]